MRWFCPSCKTVCLGCIPACHTHTINTHTSFQAMQCFKQYGRNKKTRNIKRERRSIKYIAPSGKSANSTEFICKYNTDTNSHMHTHTINSHHYYYLYVFNIKHNPYAYHCHLPLATYHSNRCTLAKHCRTHRTLHWYRLQTLYIYIYIPKCWFVVVYTLKK